MNIFLENEQHSDNPKINTGIVHLINNQAAWTKGDIGKHHD